MVKRAHKGGDGKFHVGGHAYAQLVGSRAQVWHGTAYKTGYGKAGLTKKDLIKNKWGKIVSRKKQKTARKEKRLQKHGFLAKKGEFGFVKRSPAKSVRRHKRKHQGTRKRK